MHVLTKIFVVLVTLLAVLLVPLVVVYAHNENAYEKRFQAAESQASAARSALQAAQAAHGAVLTRKDGQIQELNTANSDLRKQSDRQATEIRTLETRLVEAEALDSEIRAQLAMLAKAVDAGQDLTETLIDDLRNIRRIALASEREKVELDEALRDAQARFDAAEEARKAIQEELHRIKDEYAESAQNLAAYVHKFGKLTTDTIATGALVDRKVDCHVISVRRSAEQVLAEIDAGSRDGIRTGWVMTVVDNGFVARLRIVEVDINRSTGVVELEDPDARGQVTSGQRVFARPLQ